MPKDQLRGDLDYVYPPFLERVLALLANCNARGKRYFATELFRDMARSDALYRAYLAGGPRAARGGRSGHNFGLAADFALDTSDAPGLQPSWKKEDFAVLIEEAVKLGLKVGAAYGDFPHVEWPTWVSANELTPLRSLYTAAAGLPLAKLKAVWQYCDEHAPNLPVIPK